jgi:hypothetical protein
MLFSMSDMYDDTTTKPHDHVCSLFTTHTLLLLLLLLLQHQWISPVTITMSTITHTSLA